MKVVKDSAVLTSTGRSIHHRGAKTDSSHDREVLVWRQAGGSRAERTGRCIGSDLLLDVSWCKLNCLICEHQCFNFDFHRQPVEISEQGGSLGTLNTRWAAAFWISCRDNRAKGPGVDGLAVCWSCAVRGTGTAGRSTQSLGSGQLQRKGNLGESFVSFTQNYNPESQPSNVFIETTPHFLQCRIALGIFF